MIATLIISGCAIVGMFLLLFLFPEMQIKGHSFPTFYLAPLLGAIILISIGSTDYKDLGQSLIAQNGINPLEILCLFFSMSFLSIVLDEAGFFSHIATLVASRAHGSQWKLFVLLYLLTGLLTIFTSNDIIILTFTPFLIAFCREAKINPLPYLVSEFVAANTYSILLIIGNPTNIYLGESFGISFGQYAGEMVLAAVFCGIVSFTAMALIFAKKLKTPMAMDAIVQPLKNPFLSSVSLAILGITIIFMAIGDFIRLPLWIISVCGAGLLLVITLLSGISHRDNLRSLGVSMTRLPYEVLPFLLSMFVIVIALKDQGVILKIAEFLGKTNPYLGIGVGSFLAANLLNNIPMSVFFTEILKSYPTLDLRMVYLAIISSNIGAFLTPVGALAGVMWKNILRRYEVPFSYKDFFRYLTPLSLLSLGAAFGGFCLTFH